MSQPHLERPSRHDSTASGEEVETNNRFQDGTLTGTLTTQHCDTGQADASVLHADVTQLVNHVDELAELLEHKSTSLFLLLWLTLARPTLWWATLHAAHI